MEFRIDETCGLNKFDKDNYSPGIKTLLFGTVNKMHIRQCALQ